MKIRQQGKTQAAFSLIEMAIILGVIALVLGGIWAGMKSVSDSREVSDTMADIAKICAEVPNVFPRHMAEETGPADHWGDDITSSAIAANIIPSTAVMENELYFTASSKPSSLMWFRKNKMLDSTDVGGLRNILLTVDQGACTNILTKLPASSSASVKWVSLRGSNTAHDISGWSGTTPFFTTALPTTEMLYPQCTGYQYYLISLVC